MRFQHITREFIDRSRGIPLDLDLPDHGLEDLETADPSLVSPVFDMDLDNHEGETDSAITEMSTEQEKSELIEIIMMMMPNVIEKNYLELATVDELREIIRLSREPLDENLKKWFKEKWVRFNPQGKIMGPCARGSSKEGKPKCLPQSQAHALGKKGRASAAARKRRKDPDPERSGQAINVATGKTTKESSLKGPYRPPTSARERFKAELRARGFDPDQAAARLRALLKKQAAERAELDRRSAALDQDNPSVEEAVDDDHAVKVGDTVSFHHELKSAPGTKVKKRGKVKKIEGHVIHVMVKDKYGVRPYEIKTSDLVKESDDLAKDTLNEFVPPAGYGGGITRPPKSSGGDDDEGERPDNHYVVFEFDTSGQIMTPAIMFDDRDNALAYIEEGGSAIGAVVVKYSFGFPENVIKKAWEPPYDRESKAILKQLKDSFSELILRYQGPFHHEGGYYESQQGVTEGRFDEPLTGWHIVYRNSGNPVHATPSFETKEQAQKYLMTKMFANHQDYKVVHTAGVTEGHADQQRKIFKKNGQPVGEVGIDRESSPGVGQWYMKCYAQNIDKSGYDSYEEAVAELKHCLKQGVAEGSLNEFAPGGDGGDDDNRSKSTLKQAIEYIKNKYPYFKKYTLDGSYRYINPAAVADWVKKGEIGSAPVDPMNHALEHLGMSENPAMSGMDATHIGREDWWHTYENNQIEIAALHFVGQNQGWIIIAGNTEQNLADVVQVFRNSGILPDLELARQTRRDKAASRQSKLSTTPLAKDDYFGEKVYLGWDIWKVLEFTKTGKIKAEKVKSTNPEGMKDEGVIRLFNPLGPLINNKKAIAKGQEYKEYKKSQQGVAEGNLSEFAPPKDDGREDRGRNWPLWLRQIDQSLQKKGFAAFEFTPNIGYVTRWTSTRDPREHIDVVFAPFLQNPGEKESGVIKIQVTLVKKGQVATNDPIIKKIYPDDQNMKLVNLILGMAIQSMLSPDQDEDSVAESKQKCPECGGPAYADQMLAEKKDACYHKVKSRYKVWPPVPMHQEHWFNVAKKVPRIGERNRESQ